MEDLSKDEKDWSTWKKLYKTVDQKAKFKKQAVGGQDQFGATHGTLMQAPQAQQGNDPTRLAANLDEYFDTLAAAAMSPTRKGFRKI